MFKSLGIGVLALLVAACGASRTRQPAPQVPDASAWQGKLPQAGKIYYLDAAQSELRVLVYRAGPLARFGHNHVVVNRALRGEVSLAGSPDTAAFWLQAPVAGFVVDEPPARSEEGSDFAAEVSGDARAGTLRNMLSAAVLDAAEFPTIVIESTRVASAAAAPASGALTASVVVHVAGHEATIDVPLRVAGDSSRLSASGSMQIRQTELGLVPYSLMMGALQVEDAMTVKFKIVALPRGR